MGDSALEALDEIESNYKLLDPKTGPAEVTRIVAEEMRVAGLLKPKNVTYRQKVFAAAEKFCLAHPPSDPANGFEPNSANELKIYDWLERNGMDGTEQNHFEMAFAALRESLIQPLRPTRAAAQVRVRKMNIGGREIEISHTALDLLSARELEQLSQNSKFAQAVDALPPKSR
jgi:hypothetical protein